MNKTFESFRKDILAKASKREEHIRFGQEVFNIIDSEYHVARKVQFVDGVDCFYDDSKIDAFLYCCYNRL